MMVKDEFTQKKLEQSFGVNKEMTKSVREFIDNKKDVLDKQTWINFFEYSEHKKVFLDVYNNNLLNNAIEEATEVLTGKDTTHANHSQVVAIKNALEEGFKHVLNRIYVKAEQDISQIYTL